MKTLSRFISIFFIWFFIISFLLLIIKVDIKKELPVQKNDSSLTIFLDNKTDYDLLTSNKYIKYKDKSLYILASNIISEDLFSITVNFYIKNFYEDAIKICLDSKNIISFILNW